MTPDFRAALLDPAAVVPDGVTDGAGRPAGRRFDVYRNNVAASLTEALETAFPVLRRLVGPDYFAAMAGVFLRAHPPRTPLLFAYGAEMPGFLARFPPVAHLPYLPDVARIEQGLRESYHAADTTPVAPEALAALPSQELAGLRIALAPSVRLIRSAHPIHGIWSANRPGEDGQVTATGAQSVLITRPGYDPAAHLLPEAAATTLEGLAEGGALGMAVEAGGTDLDLPALLSLLLGQGAIVALTSDDTPEAHPIRQPSPAQDLPERL